MRILCLHKDSVRRLQELGARIKDLTPLGLDGTPYHLASLTQEQARAIDQLSVKYEDVTPKVLASLPPQSSEGFLYSRGGKIPNGTRLRMSYKSRSFEGEVRAGAIWMDGKRYDSPSSAARAVGRGPVNGWMVWEYFEKEADKWFPLYRLRQKSRAAQTNAGTA